MKTKPIVDSAEYGGNFVAMKSFNEHTVVASGKDPVKVRAQAQEKGCPSPVVMFIPRDDTYHIF